MVTRVTRKVTKRVAKPTQRRKIVSARSEKASICSDTFFEYVKTRAYHIWQESGYPHGNDAEDWKRAEKDIKAKFTVKK
ncbi:MAG: DUF2934 domain-containing protein [PVC group bacterium]|nr:DUF2934 domain-containing protein [PVC group bacterium]